MNGYIAMFYVSFKISNEKNPTNPIKSLTSKALANSIDMKN